MPERDGYLTLEEVRQELKATEEQVRALIALLGIQPHFFPDDGRRRFYKITDVDRMKEAIGRK
ncbi:MAG: hypothetical protein H0X24_04430 [Ktedonobacterales bacterium]|nr:hypothetical protein [Ktedonobacterales bacterium]